MAEDGGLANLVTLWLTELSTTEGSKMLNLIYTFLDLLLTSLLKPYLTEKGYRVSEISLTNSTDVARLAALLTACPNSITLDETKNKKKKRLKFHNTKFNITQFLWLKLVWPGSCRAWPRPCVWQTHVHRCQRTVKQYRWSTIIFFICLFNQNWNKPHQIRLSMFVWLWPTM